MLSDKTGTLTCNDMVFKNMSIEGVSFGQNYEDVPSQSLKDKNVTNFNMVDDTLDKILSD